MLDIHTYPGTDILINTFGIKDKDELRKKEQEIVSEATSEILEFDLSIKNKEDYKGIHQYLFSDIYPWAGEYRTTFMSKPENVLGGLSVSYGDVEDFDRKLDELFESAKKSSPERMKPTVFKNHIRKLSADIWRVHPFREGNTRTISVFADRYCHQYGYVFNSEFIRDNSQLFRDALVRANAYNDGHKLLEEDARPLKVIFDDAIKESPERKKQRIKSIEKGRER